MERRDNKSVDRKKGWKGKKGPSDCRCGAKMGDEKAEAEKKKANA